VSPLGTKHTEEQVRSEHHTEPNTADNLCLVLLTFLHFQPEPEPRVQQDEFVLDHSPVFLKDQIWIIKNKLGSVGSDGSYMKEGHDVTVMSRPGSLILFSLFSTL